MRSDSRLRATGCTSRPAPSLALRPAALAPAEGEEPLLGPVTAAAEAKGVKPGMRMGEGLATCPELVLVEQDPSAAEQAWEEILRASRTRASRSNRATSVVSISRRAVSSVSTAALRLRSSAPSLPSVLPGIHALARPGAGLPLSQRRTSRVPGRS